MEIDERDPLAAARVDPLEQWARLTLRLIPGLGPQAFAALLERFGSAQAICEAPPAELREVDGVSPRLVAALIEAVGGKGAIEVLDRCRQHDVDVWYAGTAGYPALLEQIADPPLVLFGRGRWMPADELAVAIVGARHATAYGRQVAESLARDLALAGVTVVSGLARGVDAAAHRAALAAGGRTIAVLGGGHARLYPREHEGLAREIVEQGVVYSELAPEVSPRSTSFPRRNRIVTGISLGVVVVEAALRSGALISARLAGEQGRDVFAVPGRIDSRMSRGTHRLLRDGAQLVQSVDDILEALGPLMQPATTAAGRQVHIPRELTLTEQESRILAAIDSDPTELDAIVATTGVPVARVLATVSVLEMKRLVRRLSGTRLIRWGGAP